MGKWFDYRQNNSGGGFITDEKRGISVSVLIEAASRADANEKAESIGLYFDGIDSGSDCDCCGDRWYRAYGDGDDTPNVYGEEVVPGQPYKEDGPFSTKWVDGPEGYLHYADGRVEPFGL